MDDVTSRSREGSSALLPIGMEPMMRMACRMMAAQAATQAHMIEQIKAMHDELHGFLDHRLDEDRSSTRRLAGCMMPDEVAAIWSQFVSTAVSDYAREMSRMMELGTHAFEEAVKDMDRQAAAVGPTRER